MQQWMELSEWLRMDILECESISDRMDDRERWRCSFSVIFRRVFILASRLRLLSRGMWC